MFFPIPSQVGYGALFGPGDWIGCRVAALFGALAPSPSRNDQRSI
jgi:hypothetical protein